MQSTGLIAGAALGCLVACGLFTGQSIAQTSSTDPVSKLVHFVRSGEPETKQRAGSTAKNSSKTHPAAKKHALTKPASKEGTSNGASEVTISEPPIDGETMRRLGSPGDADEIDRAASAQSTLESDTPSATAPVVKAVSPGTIAPVDKPNSGGTVVLQTPSSSIGSIFWLLGVIAALGGASAVGLLAWFLIEPNASAEVWVHLTET